jgi:TPR repeat protein
LIIFSILIVAVVIASGISYSYKNYKLTTADCAPLQTSGKTDEFIQCLKDGARLGHNGKRAYLAVIYMEGRYVKQDYAESVKWARKAAKYENRIAQNVLGVAYQNGFGVEKNYEIAFEWYKKAAEQENPTAIFNLGAMYYNGYGVKKDERMAMELITKAAELGDPNAIALIK